MWAVLSPFTLPSSFHAWMGSHCNLAGARLGPLPSGEAWGWLASFTFPTVSNHAALVVALQVISIRRARKRLSTSRFGKIAVRTSSRLPSLRRESPRLERRGSRGAPASQHHRSGTSTPETTRLPARGSRCRRRQDRARFGSGGTRRLRFVEPLHCHSVVTEHRSL